MSTTQRTSGADVLDPGPASGSPAAELDVGTDLSSADDPFRGPLTAELTRFLMAYKFGLDELMTKVNILQQESALAGQSSPIEHVSARLKSLDSIVEKARRIDCPPTLSAVQDQIFDIAGIRIVCSFISDAYAVMDMLTRQPDVEVLRVRDYIAAPKANGYKSLHVVVETPVYMSDRVEHVRVEVQIRTVSMDFWASLEHKIQYQYHRDVPPRLARDLRAAADVAQRLDEHMEQLHNDVVADQRATP